MIRKLEERLYLVSKDHHFMIKSELGVIKDEFEMKLAVVEER